MSCPNGLLVRFKVRVIDSPFELKSVPKVTKVGGISLGTDGTEELTEYNKVIEIEPDNGSAFLNRGNTKFRLGDKKGACNDWKTALISDIIPF